MKCCFINVEIDLKWARESEHRAILMTKKVMQLAHLDWLASLDSVRYRPLFLWEMECIIGVTGGDFTMVATDTHAARSIMALKLDEDKMYKLTDRTVLAVCGEGGDADQFAEYIQKNIKLYKMRNSYDLTTTAAANFTRRQVADFLRSRTPYQVNSLIAGFEDVAGPQLYYLDYLGALMPVKFGAHGYGSFFSLSVFDRFYKPGLSREDAYKLMTMAVEEVKTRFIVNMHGFKVRIVDKDGIHDLPDIKA